MRDSYCRWEEAGEPILFPPNDAAYSLPASADIRGLPVYCRPSMPTNGPIEDQNVPKSNQTHGYPSCLPAAGDDCFLLRGTSTVSVCSTGVSSTGTPSLCQRSSYGMSTGSGSQRTKEIARTRGSSGSLRMENGLFRREGSLRDDDRVLLRAGSAPLRSECKGAPVHVPVSADDTGARRDDERGFLRAGSWSFGRNNDFSRRSRLAFQPDASLAGFAGGSAGGIPHEFPSYPFASHASFGHLEAIQASGRGDSGVYAGNFAGGPALGFPSLVSSGGFWSQDEGLGWDHLSIDGINSEEMRLRKGSSSSLLQSIQSAEWKVLHKSQSGPCNLPETGSSSYQLAETGTSPMEKWSVYSFLLNPRDDIGRSAPENMQPSEATKGGVQSKEALLLSLAYTSDCPNGTPLSPDSQRDVERYNLERPEFCPRIPAHFVNPFPLFNPIVGLTISQFRQLVSVVARYRSNSDGNTLSKIVCINYYEPVKVRVQSLMLVELHPELSIVEFLDRRLPAVIRGVMGNRLDRDFLVFYNGHRLTRMQLRDLTISDLEDTNPINLRKLCSNPLYGHMLRVLAVRPQGTSFCDINLSPTDPTRVCRSRLLAAAMRKPSTNKANGECALSIEEEIVRRKDASQFRIYEGSFSGKKCYHHAIGA